MKQISKVFFIVLLSMLVGTYSHAQNLTFKIKGIISDKNTKTPIIGASILVKEQKTGTSTDKDGKFELTLYGDKSTLIISCLGYLKETFFINQKNINSEYNIELTPTEERLKDVTVTGKSEARLLREMALPVSVISMNQLQGTVSDINDILTKTSGVKIRASGGVGSTSKISIRGLEGKRVGFFIDGNPMNTNLDFVNINDIPVDMIDRIEVYKGIVPAKFGGSSIGGAVNIVLKEYPPRYMDASYTIQSFNVHKYSTALKTNKNGIEMGVGGFYTVAKNNYDMKIPTRKELKNNSTNTIIDVTRKHDRFEKLVIGGGITSKRWYFDKMKIEPAIVIGSKEIQGIEYPVLEAHTNSKAFIMNGLLEKKDFLIHGLDLDFDNTYTYAIAELVDTAKFTYGWDKQIYPSASNYGGEVGKTPNNSHDINETFIQRLNFNYLISKTQSINFNWHFQLVNGSPNDTIKDKAIGYKTSFDSKMHSITLGINHEFHSLNKFFTNSTTLKYHYYDINTKSIVAYGMSQSQKIKMSKSDYGISEAIRLRFSPELLIKGSAVYDVRIPTSNELLGNGYTITASGNLMPEKNLSLNIGCLFLKQQGSRKLVELEFNAFYNHLTDYIKLKGSALLSKYENFGIIDSRGIEVEAKSDITKFLYLWGNLTYQELRDKRKTLAESIIANPTYNSKMPNKPSFYANAGLELHHENIFGGKGHNTRLFGDASFIEEYLYDFEQSIYQKRKIPQSLTFNAGIEHSLNFQQIYLTLQINNITNQRVVSEFNKPLPLRNYAFKIRFIIK
ncbi:TonB-dependent receptor plug domain-containing protein [Halosquirtibacter xylanolyticus]|uniref:TonB-dependent receptor n=1 Tax=Halosquirtibacter xylanolyticus TaxID=3374599 RepID=UPI00374933E6|nr:TonB-dependent receptor plug domain-containing protein [Prolixibacteraceae bacterium]